MSRALVEGGRDERHKVLIAGGGVAGVETLLALHELARGRVVTELIAPEPAFWYRPLSVAEPFALAEVKAVPLGAIAAEHEASYRRDALAAIDPARHLVRTAAGAELEYDLLVIAIGARASKALPNVLTFRGPADVAAFGELLAELEQGSVKRVAFTVPHLVGWPLPIYELALMTARHLATREASGIEISVVTSEREPLDIFGSAPSANVRSLLEQAGVRLLASSAPASLKDGVLTLMSGEAVPADRVVALPKLDVPPLPGVPQGRHGFIPTDLFGRVDGVEDVYAVGDVTSFLIKQGGLAAQQADVAAESIAASAGRQIEPRPFRPVLRGTLIGGPASLHLRSEPGREPASEAAFHPLWWPPGKVAGRYLAPYLARRTGDDQTPPPLSDIEPTDPEYLQQAEEDYAGTMELTLTAAEASARWRDYEDALRWLAAAEQLSVVLPPEYAHKRRDWKRALRSEREAP